MKKILLTFASVLFFAIVLAQEKFKAFSLQKKSIDLSTGICMSYVDTGNPSGSPVLLLHGYTDTSRSFELLIEDLKSINGNLRIIAPDLRGHGDTSMPDAEQCKGAPEKCFTPEQLAEDVISLMNHLKIQKMYVVGHSMGSIVAQRLALHSTDRVNSMVLLETFVHGKECDTIQDFLIGELVEKNWKRIMEEKSGIENWPEDVYSITPMSMEEKVKTFLKENWVVEAAAAPDFWRLYFPRRLEYR
jgi:pimeloyl-ACP methyl ester carboxylesterase